MRVIVGLDEVGRGAWAGPLVVGAVVLPKPIDGLKDSKKLTKLQREKLATIINSEANVGLGWVSHRQVDDLGLTKAISKAMLQALKQIKFKYDEVIIDGNFNFLPEIRNCRTIIGADETIDCVSAASIIAKVARDNHMVEMAKLYPVYGFESHVGYGTKFHANALKNYGPSAIHRLSYKPMNRLLPI